MHYAITLEDATSLDHQGRTVLQRVVRGRMVFTPRPNPETGVIDGYDFEAPTRFDKLFTGLVVKAPRWDDIQDLVRDAGRGLEAVGPEETGEAEYGRLLDQRRVTC